MIPVTCIILMVLAFHVVSTSSIKQLTVKQYSALESLYSNTNGVNWAWDDFKEFGSNWNFTHKGSNYLSLPVLEKWQGLAFSCFENGTVPHQSNPLDVKIGYGYYAYDDYSVGSKMELSSCNVTKLYLASHNLYGLFPLDSLLNLSSSLTHVHMAGNFLHGPLKSEIGAGLPLLKVLDLTLNMLSQKLPTILPLRLRTLMLSNNAFSGSLPESYSLYDLECIDVCANKLTGKVPRTWGTLNKLRRLNLCDNLFNGTINVDALPNSLSFYSIQQNKFTGTIPLLLSKLTNLKEIYIDVNSLSGRLPEFFTEMKNLTALDVYDNNLFGTIPSSIGHLTHLKVLSMGLNQFSKTIPTSLCSLIKLTFLGMYGNRLSGSIPEV